MLACPLLEGTTVMSRGARAVGRKGAISVVAVLIAIVISLQFSARGQRSAKAALSGAVSSDAEGPMEGVLVSAKQLGANISFTVVSDKQGRYSFAPNELPAGQYK